MFPVLLASSSTAPIWELSGPSWNLIGELEEEVGGGRREGWDESTQNYARFLNTCYMEITRQRNTRDLWGQMLSKSPVPAFFSLAL